MPEPVAIRVSYDFASSLCYVAHRVMERMAGDLAELAIELVWTPLDLTRITGWPRGSEIAGYRRDNALRVARELGVAIRLPARWPDSRAAGAVALALGGTPRAAAWRERVFSALHEESRCLDEPGVLASLARDLRIPAGELAERDLGALAAASDRALRAGVTGVPTFLLGEWPCAGIQADAVMRSLLERWVAKTRRASSAVGDGR